VYEPAGNERLADVKVSGVLVIVSGAAPPKSYRAPLAERTATVTELAWIIRVERRTAVAVTGVPAVTPDGFRARELTVTGDRVPWVAQAVPPTTAWTPRTVVTVAAAAAACFGLSRGSPRPDRERAACRPDGWRIGGLLSGSVLATGARGHDGIATGRRGAPRPAGAAWVGNGCALAARRGGRGAVRHRRSTAPSSSAAYRVS
jgi:hypothetical protein